MEDTRVQVSELRGNPSSCGLAATLCVEGRSGELAYARVGGRVRGMMVPSQNHLPECW